MCGRFTLTAEESDLAEEFDGIEFPTMHTARYNIAPSQPVLAIPNTEPRSAGFFVWGMIPEWAKDPSIGNRLINARAETLGEKPAFRGSFRHKRCLIVADGFYEWESAADGKTKVPYYVSLASGKPFAFAGLWSEWHSPDGSEVRTCTIVTTTANNLLAPIHNRMPVIVPKQDRALWLDPTDRNQQTLGELLRPLPGELMRIYPVSTRVNNPANDDESCIRPI